MQQQILAPVRARSFAIQGHQTDVASGRVPVRVQAKGADLKPLVDTGQFVFGDDQDLTDDCEFLGNGVLVQRDDLTGAVTLTTSITGLPPVYRCDHDGRTSFASDPASLLDSTQANRRLDLQTVHALARSGRPASGRTLFEGITQVPPGVRLRIPPSGTVKQVGSFTPDPGDFAGEAGYCDAQRAAFRAALTRMDLENSVLSLTAGMDTRAILAVLAEQDRWIDAVTIRGERQSIDSKWAGELARSCGFHHEVVSLGDGFSAALPELCIEASRTSHGLASFSEAADLYLYSQLGGRYRARLTGHLGNQVGRSASEGIATRGARLDVLAPELRPVEAEAPSHWMIDAAGGARLDDPAFQIQVESLCSSQANYTLGSARCLQQSPYADRTMIAQKIAFGVTESAASLRSIRARDLRHRFLGDPAARSFQRQLIAESDGPVGGIPINWGWQARGGISARGFALGLRGFCDSALGVASRRVPAFSELRRVLAVDELAEFDRGRYLYRDPMPEFVRETLLSDKVRSSGLFDIEILESLVTTGFEKQENHATIIFALDLALVVDRVL